MCSFQAKLPRGIENIRPHLHSVDNVPLLVNLFTDCSVESKDFLSTFYQTTVSKHYFYVIE